jgi:iron complex transport system substrate-binding protein
MKSKPGKFITICLMLIFALSLLTACESEPESTSEPAPESTQPAEPETIQPTPPEATEPPAITEPEPPEPSESETPAVIEITDQLGRKVTIKGVPERIISLAPSNTEIIYALGLEDRLVGVTDYCNYPPEAAEKPSVGGFSTTNIEEVVALAPDLILATSIHESEIIPQLETHGLTVVALAPKTFDDVLDAIEIAGKVTGTVDKAEELLTGMRSRINAVTEKLKDLPEDRVKRVFYLTWHDPLMTSGGDTLINEFISLAGGVNIFEELSGAEAVDMEVLLAREPQVFIAGIGMGSGEEQGLQFLMTEERLANTEAVINGQVYGIHMDLTGRAGPRIVDGLEQFARCIHPEIFGEP